MRRVVPLALLVLFSAAPAFSSCTATNGPSWPEDAVEIPPTFSPVTVAGLPDECSGQVYYEASSSLCPPGVTYFLCDGTNYTEYDCQDPGAGWSRETLTQYDRVGTDPAPCDGGAGETIYVENSLAAPAENQILAFRYCNGTLPTALSARYSTGGSGAADLYNRGILDADQQLTLNDSRTLLFAVNQGSDTIAAFQIAKDGTLTPSPGSPYSSGGPAPASIGVTGDILVVANKGVDGIRNLSKAIPSYATFKIASDGSLTPAAPPYKLSPGASPTQAYVARAGKLVFGTEETGVLRGFQLSPSGKLTLSPGSPLGLAASLFTGGRPNPVWPAGLSAHPTEPILYTGIPNNDSIASFAFTAAGKLELIVGETEEPSPHPSLPCWSTVSSDGRWLYFADAGAGDVSVWDIHGDPGMPAFVQTFLLQGGGNPWGLRIDPTGQLLYVITPRQVRQVPDGAGQLLHALTLLSDGTIGDEVAGSPATIPAPIDTNIYGLAIVRSQ